MSSYLIQLTDQTRDRPITSITNILLMTLTDYVQRSAYKFPSIPQIPKHSYLFLGESVSLLPCVSTAYLHTRNLDLGLGSFIPGDELEAFIILERHTARRFPLAFLFLHSFLFPQHVENLLHAATPFNSCSTKVLRGHTYMRIQIPWRSVSYLALV